MKSQFFNTTRKKMENMRDKWKGFVLQLLCITLLMTSVPAVIFAEDNNTTGKQDISWGIKYIGADLTMDKYSGNHIRVAVFDTGVSPHDDLKIAGGVSFVDYTTSYADDNGHGTIVAGSIAARNNNIGIVGVAPEVDLYAVKVLDAFGHGNYKNLIEGIDWAINNKIQVINISFGDKKNDAHLEQAIRKGINAGITFVVSSGNNGHNGSDTITYPAKYPEVISVGAVDNTLHVANFSSHGNRIDVVAPGADIMSTTNDGGYEIEYGTSIAAAYVTGEVAVILSYQPKIKPADIKDIILKTTTKLGPKDSYGNGIVNVARAVNIVEGPIENTAYAHLKISQSECANKSVNLKSRCRVFE